MSALTQIPVYEEVCVQTEVRVTGYRDPFDSEALAEEQFSSGVPSFGFDYEVAAANLRYANRQPPGYVVSLPPDTDTYEPSPVPIPGAIFLFGVVAVMYAIFQAVRKA